MATDAPTDSSLPTRESLLSRLRDAGDDEGWQRFFDCYWSLIYGLARRRGLNDSEAREALQETLVALVRTMPTFRYEPERCSFKSWLRHLAQKKIADQFRRRSRGAALFEGGGAGAEDPLDQLPDPASLAPDEQWDRDWERAIYEQALEHVKAEVGARHFQLFHHNVVLGLRAGEVARTFAVSLPTVYLAKHRVSAAVKRAVRRLQAGRVEAPGH